MLNFFAALQAALVSLPHAIAVLVGCSLFAANCGASSTPLSLLANTTTETSTVSIPFATPTPSDASTIFRTTSVPPAVSTLMPPAASSGSNSSNYSQMIHSDSTSGQTTITTSVNGQTSTETFPAQSGTRSIYISNTVNGQTSTFATTTPLTNEDAAHIQQDAAARAAAMEQEIRSSIERDQQSMQNNMVQTFNF